MKPYIAICVGHSRFINGKRDGGAVSVGNVNEWNYNRELADVILSLLWKNGIRSFVISDYPGTGYVGAMQKLAGELKEKGATHALEMHFNASDNPSASGHEWLHWHNSAKGKALASALEKTMRTTLPQMKARGVKAITPDERGAAFLNLTHCPSVICEPGFGTNPGDWQVLSEKKLSVANAITLGLRSFLNPSQGA